ncbi:Crp/Fnr family transcriptional regulator [Chelatococcus reniformis]|uniref:Crp/Fnr family transcriptional regulator n=1 Tax=Chelatococcus reniformis TaxID=1494448 RepID=A0A916XL76_9HYPH|nr:Crp/Fnr family transcriptional regulator [Chelatococcus reniformis]GGC80552.1 hypothetical protein GCM10010994_43200 [Chelatococcus reniformis]
MTKPIEIGTAVKNRILRLLPSEVFDRLAGQLVRVELRQGEILYEPGDVIDLIYFPSEGIISLITRLSAGADVETAIVGRREALGLPAWWEGRTALQRAVIQVPGYAHCVGAAALRSTIGTDPEANELLVRCTDLALSQAMQSVACVAQHSAEERLARWLLMCCDRCDTRRFPLTQEFLAAMLCVQRTTVTLAAQALQRAGALRYSRGRLDVVDVDILRRRACGCHEEEWRRSKSILPPILDSEVAVAELASDPF